MMPHEAEWEEEEEASLLYQSITISCFEILYSKIQI